MRYLFFDIECADGNKAICEFGYVLTDENFNILRERNLIIDPECRFNLRGRVKQDDLELTYPYDYYYKFYPFSDVYDDIKNLLTRKDLLIFGHAVNNDIGFIIKDCLRYKLPLFDFTAYDVQRMLPVFDKKNLKYTSLEKAYIDLIPHDIRTTLKDHRAVDDAKKTMLVFKAMVDNLGFTATDLIESCPKSKYDALKYWNDKKKANRNKKKRKFNREHRKEGQILWDDFYKEYLPLLGNENSRGKLVTVTAKFKEHINELKELLHIIKTKGYVACDRIAGSDYLIAINEDNRQEMLKILEHPYSCKILTFDEFIQLNK